MESLNNKTVLIVDDDKRSCFALSTYLDSHNATVLIARDGPEALAVLKKNPEVHLILLDIMMPQMDGFEILKALKEHEHYKVIPVIAVTPQEMNGDREKCLRAGAWDYVPKPLDLDVFMDTVASLL